MKKIIIILMTLISFTSISQTMSDINDAIFATTNIFAMETNGEVSFFEPGTEYNETNYKMGAIKLPDYCNKEYIKQQVQLIYTKYKVVSRTAWFITEYGIQKLISVSDLNIDIIIGYATEINVIYIVHVDH